MARIAARPTAADAVPAASIALPTPKNITEADLEGFKEQDAYLPIATVARIMRKSLPPEAKLSKGARECIQECVSEFISFVTSEAAERAAGEKRRTLTGDDALAAFNSLGFDSYGEVVKIYLARYRIHLAAQAEQRSNREGRRKTSKAAPESPQEEEEPADRS